MICQQLKVQFRQQVKHLRRLRVKQDKIGNMVKKKMITTRTANHAMPSTSRISAASPPKSDSKKNKNLKNLIKVVK